MQFDMFNTPISKSKINLIKSSYKLTFSPPCFTLQLSKDSSHIDRTIILSVSGGETSMMMAALIKQTLPYHNVVCIFSNTGLENEETLEFINQCDHAFNLNVIWIEAVTNPKHGKGVTHRITDYNRAFRNHQYKDPNHPFHAHIKKNGIPNQIRPQCSDRLKEFAIESYKKSNNLRSCPHALGMRDDEPLRSMPKKIRDILQKIEIEPASFRRMSHQCRLNSYTGSVHGYFKVEFDGDESELKALEKYSQKLRKHNLIYLLTDAWKIDKQDVNDFWESQSFRLNLKEHQGNCQTCWKKSDKKLYMLAHENLKQFEAFDWFEKTYAHVKPIHTGNNVFFRKYRSTEMILGEAGMFDRYMLQKMIKKPENDTSYSDCSSSCESYGFAI
ncbi:phosphoadenosine phosphosulfate reductase family protein [Pseudoalteromonas ulvae]|uniref:Phosphoadenosine phosphosulphate reductase domain-containing protein n=1 Tax=Pseudoalteromonas ulvae TaxID=107327 RepID=A0A244CUI9_PSEDV|nr:phosphoadenosine phosphosulfate reductase family protein [Pseudoalteromonas ulvae]OUL59277.1 hypothetical protein B1199_03130 [Pseudoalteromonas ulvae]